jgi:hypothetical protein
MFVMNRALLLLVLVACRSSSKSAAASQSLSIEQLATGWSAGNEKRTCGKLGPRGEYLGPMNAYCQWNTVARGQMHSTVGAYRDSLHGFTHLVWLRIIPDSVERRRIVDSLDTALGTQGFVAWGCPDAGRHWETDAFKIELMSSPPDRRNHSINIMAYQGQASVSDAFCPPPPGMRPRKATANRTS